MTTTSGRKPFMPAPDPASGVTARDASDGPQVPRVGGVAGGVGATVVAALLQAADAGTVTAEGVDRVHVLVCRSTASSVQAAVVLAARMPLTPVLAVVADCGDRTPGSVRHRLHMAEPNLAGVVRVPWWPSLRELDDPASRVAALAWGDATPSRSERTVPGVLDALITAVTPLVASPPARAQPPPDADTEPTAFPHVS